MEPSGYERGPSGYGYETKQQEPSGYETKQKEPSGYETKPRSQERRSRDRQDRDRRSRSRDRDRRSRSRTGREAGNGITTEIVAKSVCVMTGPLCVVGHRIEGVTGTQVEIAPLQLSRAMFRAGSG